MPVQRRGRAAPARESADTCGRDTPGRQTAPVRRGGGTEPGGSPDRGATPEQDPNQARDQRKTRDEDDGGASTGDRDRDPGSRPAKPGRGDRPDVGPVGDRRHDPDSRTPEPTPDQPGKAGRTAEPAPFVPTTAVSTDSSHAARASQAGSPSGDRRHHEPPGDRRTTEPAGDRRTEPAGDRTPWRVTGDLWDTPSTRPDPGQVSTPDRNVGDGVPDEAVRFIGERVQRFYEHPGARVELLDRGSERYRMFAEQARAMDTGNTPERVSKGREYLNEALDGSHPHVVVASVGNRIASAISLDIRHGELQLAKLGSAHQGGARGAATAVEHFVARYAADNGGMAVTSEMPLTDAHDFHHKIGRRTDRFGGAGLSEWSPSDAGQIARQAENVFDRKTLDQVRRDFEHLQSSRVADSGIDPGSSAGSLSRGLDRFDRDGGRVEIIENDTKADANVDLEPGAGVTVPSNGRTIASYDGRGRLAAVVTVRDTPDHIEIRDLRVGSDTPGAVEAGVRELVRHASRTGRPVRGNLPDAARAALDKSLRIDRDPRSPLELPGKAVTDIAHHLPDGERPPVHVVENDGGLRRDPSARPAHQDSGTPDTGTPDTHTPDTHTPDTGTPDTHTPDTHTPDSGTPDTGLSDISRRLLGEDDDGGFGFSNDPHGSSAGSPGGDPGSRRGADSGSTGVEHAAQWQPGDEKIIESVRSDRQRVGLPGESRPDVRPVHWLEARPEDPNLPRLVEAVGDDPLADVDSWSALLDGENSGPIELRTNCPERYRVFADIMAGKEPRLAAGNAFPPGEQWVEMWEWLGGEPRRFHADGPAGEFTGHVYDWIGQALEGDPPGTVAYLGGLGGRRRHTFGAYVDRTGQLRWWDSQQKQFDPEADVTGAWPPPYRRDLTSIELAVRRPAEPWVTPDAAGNWARLNPLRDESAVMAARYGDYQQPAGSGQIADGDSHGRNDLRQTTTAGTRSPLLQATVREPVQVSDAAGTGGPGLDHRSRHVPWAGVQGMVPASAKINPDAWLRLGEEWDRWIGSGHEVRTEIASYPPGSATPAELRVRYEVVDPQSGQWSGRAAGSLRSLRRRAATPSGRPHRPVRGPARRGGPAGRTELRPPGQRRRPGVRGRVPGARRGQSRASGDAAEDRLEELRSLRDGRRAAAAWATGLGAADGRERRSGQPELAAGPHDRPAVHHLPAGLRVRRDRPGDRERRGRRAWRGRWRPERAGDPDRRSPLPGGQSGRPGVVRRPAGGWLGPAGVVQRRPRTVANELRTERDDTMELNEARAAATEYLGTLGAPEPLRLADDQVTDVGWAWVLAWSTVRWFETRDPAAVPPPGTGPAVVVKATGDCWMLGAASPYDEQLAGYASQHGERHTVPLEPENAAPDDVAELSRHARAVLAEWLTANSANASEPVLPEDLGSWRWRLTEDWVLFEMPGLTNTLFLVDDPVVYDFSPSRQSVADALVAARGLRQDG